MQRKNLSKIFIVIGIMSILIFLFFVFNNYIDNSDLENTRNTSTPDNCDAIATNLTPFESYDTTSINLATDQESTIDINEIESGGPPKDGIPSIDNPKFVPIGCDDNYLADNALGISLSINGEDRFYPYAILVRHELVNDFFKDKAVLVSYCPLCGTAIAFDREVNGEVFDFGVSGFLWQSNVLMYNRVEDKSRESLWSQVLGEGVVGEYSDVELNIIPSDILEYKDWVDAHPEGLVLSRDTGVYPESSYAGADPYGDYYTNDSIWFDTDFNDTSVAAKEYILGIEIDDQHKAYVYDAIEIGTFEDEFADKTLEITKNEEGEVDIKDKESGLQIPAIAGFWFSWQAVHNDTEIYQ